jgi:dTDP-4-amino-4,6-dideoxygalactose transaminase
MKIPFNNLKKHNKIFKKAFLSSIDQIISSSSFILGKEVLKFEKKFSKLLKVNHCISCANGTDALFIALKCIGLKTNEEVITTSFSWISTSSSITHAGGKVVFCDTDEESFNIDPNKIEKLVTKKTKGIVVVHLYGNPADMKTILKIAKKYNLWVIEDCAQSHLSKIDNKYCGTFGHIGCFSFFPAKNLGAFGDAGAIVTNKKKLANKIRLFANHGGKNIHKFEGINSRMDTLQAAILNLKLPFLKKWSEQRILNAKIYNENLKNITQLVLPKFRKNTTATFHQYTIKIQNKRNKLKNFLKKKQIDTQIYYSKILPKYKAYNYIDTKEENFKNSIKNSKQLLCLPIYPELSKKEIFYIINNIKKFFHSK